MDIKSIAWLVEEANIRNCKISEVVVELEANSQNRTVDEVINQMDEYYSIMQDSVNYGKKEKLSFVTDLQNDCIEIMNKFYKSGRSILGDVVSDVVVSAMAVSGCNACMGRIVAAPTAGSCGIMPAVLTVCESRGFKREDIVLSMFTSSGMADLIRQYATFAGAGGGCQAECGSAAAMAACAAAELMGGTPSQCADAFALALSNMLGLICDPIAGFVEYPCMTRNVMSAVHAIISAEMAVAGFRSIIPADEVIIAMKEVGDAMDERFKETALGGLAGTPTGRAMAERILGKKK